MLLKFADFEIVSFPGRATARGADDCVQTAAFFNDAEQEAFYLSEA
jgi:hypothetical protein